MSARDDFTMSWDLGRELIIENFAGGGTSEGLELESELDHRPPSLRKRSAYAAAASINWSEP